MPKEKRQLWKGDDRTGVLSQPRRFREEKGEVCWKGFADTRAVLEGVGKIKAITERYSRYGLKHLFEKKAGYLPKGILVAVATYSKFRYKVYDKSSNSCFNISNAR
jgi:hypothetical protein